jgi:hypothetical protein
MDIKDIVFSSSAPSSLKRAIMDIVFEQGITDHCMKVLTPTDTNNDVNGSQHVSNGGTDFTYRDVTESDLWDATSIGYYDYFGTVNSSIYTGHSYEGSERRFSAIVINPPEYAIDIRF